ncbi:tetratricopeptide repeat protein [Marinimicrobium alkaliphilum]|uniref:tetratricopeptide repeat protein n=1 Tax=Marinimicrobium alkaliphilum TaxID=2202654 RepID=UPI000DB9998A|nr:tetratricopeptide repeat protein [Marinimicrobium alkaliphilum]
MTTSSIRRLTFSCTVAGLSLGGCGTLSDEPRTLADLDRPLEQNARALTSAPADSARQAYYRYMETAADDDRARNLALARLADLELAESYALSAQDNYRDDQRYQDTLRRTVTLLETALTDYPNARGNDRKLYQLAKSYDELGRHAPSQHALRQLVDRHPNSEHYAEAHFRLAEAAFAEGNFMAAEMGYTAAINHNPDAQFQERAQFKRGWARYRQGAMNLAIEDFVAVIQHQGFADPADVAPDERALYNEYFRSLALSMVNHPTPDQVPRQLRNAGLADSFPAYFAASDLLERQSRISDAVQLWQHFLQAAPEGWAAVRAHAQQAALWRAGRFHQRALAATEDLYTAFAQQPARARGVRAKSAQRDTRALIHEAARHYHARYQRDSAPADLKAAQQWYQRYLRHFDGYALQDGVALAYADLLAQTDDTLAAFEQYARAGFDGSLIINPEAAYAAIALLSELITDESDRWLDRYLIYTRVFVQLYPTDERTTALLTNAASTAYEHQHYPSAIAFIEQALPDLQGRMRFDAQQLLVQSHIHQSQWSDAENAAHQLARHPNLSPAQRAQADDLWAYSVYRQAQAAEADGEWDQAIADYQRIHSQAPASDYAAGGLYNAIALSVEQARWLDAIALMQRFQADYPDHGHRNDVERQLTQAYLATGQTAQAARQYEQLALSEQDEQAQRAALWKAAELHQKQKDTAQAIDAYRRYAHRYPEPYPQNVEAMHRLADLYRETGQTDNRQFWERRLVQADRNQSDTQKTTRTSLLAAQASLSLGQHALERFRETPLRLPLEESLARKTEHMQSAIRHFATSAAYGFAELSSEATHRIGDIYETLARDMLASDRPPELTADERIQYDILLEDRAFPFEDRAIEFYERNLQRARKEGFNPWMTESRKRLEVLFPARYARPPRTGLYLTQSGTQDNDRGEQTP